jgi:hypothetical protein
MRIRVGVYDLTLEIRGFDIFLAESAEGKSRKVRKEKPTVFSKALGVLCVHLTLRSLREMYFFTQSARRETS